MSQVYDMGPYYDGKCCVCREWLHPGDEIYMKAENAAEGVKHTMAHPTCAGVPTNAEIAAREHELNLMNERKANA